MSLITNVTPDIKLTEWEGPINFDEAQTIVIPKWEVSMPREIFKQGIMKHLDGLSFAQFAVISRAFRVVAFRIIGREYSQEIIFLDQIINRLDESKEVQIQFLKKVRSLETNLPNLWPLNKGISFLKSPIVQVLSTYETGEMKQLFHEIDPPLSFVFKGEEQIYQASLVYNTVRNGTAFNSHFALITLVKHGYEDVAIQEAFLTEDEELRESRFETIATMLIDMKKYDQVPRLIENIVDEGKRAEVDAFLAKSLAEGSD